MEVLPGGVPVAAAILAWAFIGLVYFGMHPTPKSRFQHDVALVAGIMATVSPVAAVLIYLFVSYSAYH
jgi:hypothetical protein